MWTSDWDMMGRFTKVCTSSLMHRLVVEVRSRVLVQIIIRSYISSNRCVVGLFSSNTGVVLPFIWRICNSPDGNCWWGKPDTCINHTASIWSCITNYPYPFNPAPVSSKSSASISRLQLVTTSVSETHNINYLPIQEVINRTNNHNINYNITWTGTSMTRTKCTCSQVTHSGTDLLSLTCVSRSSSGFTSLSGQLLFTDSGILVVCNFLPRLHLFIHQTRVLFTQTSGGQFQHRQNDTHYVKHIMPYSNKLWVTVQVGYMRLT